ncbi:MAG: Lrp/AsnC ligand binding domain-containing protein [Thaumarchaeota archaeon]|nr:Lrp/AsnC ligand binding domain-containing protein [Nitrososphaerota archaeon]
MRAYVLLHTKPGTSEEVLRALKATREVEGVILADSVFGRFDAVIVMEVSNLKALSEAIYQVVEKNPNVTHTETAISLFEEPLKRV